MISMARIFGAPETVPMGSTLARASRGVFPSAKMPSTVETRCITWE